MSKLQEYLQQLNSAETQWGIWVNPDNPTEEFRTGQFLFENGGLRDGWVCIGNLEELSFGSQSTYDAFEEYLKQNRNVIRYGGRTVKVNPRSLLDAYSSGNLSEGLVEFLEDEASDIEEEWAEVEAENFVENEPPDILEAALEEQYA